MTPKATRVLIFGLVAALTLGAAAAWACERSKSANAGASACAMKSTTVAAKSCAASASCPITASCPAGSCSAAKKADVTAASKPAARTAKPVAMVPAKKSSATTAGMRAYRDSETGIVGGGPVVGIDADGTALVSGTPVVLTEQALPGGQPGRFVDLQGTGEDYATMTIDARGHRVFHCAPPRVAKSKTPAAPAATAYPEK